MKKINLTKIAKKTGLSIGYISNLKNGRKTNPTLKTIIALSFTLRVKPTLDAIVKKLNNKPHSRENISSLSRDTGTRQTGLNKADV